MSEKIKPCPFCGGQVKIDNIGDKKENIYNRFVIVRK